MDIEKLIEVLNNNWKDGLNKEFPVVVDSLTDKFKMQRSDIPGINEEWIWQDIDQFDYYCGQIAYKLDSGKFLVIGFYG